MYTYTSDLDSLFSGTSAGVVGGALAAVAGLFIFISLIVIALGVLKIVGTWRLLTKAGKPGWGSLIPFYSDYLLCKAVGITPWWVLIVALSSILSFIPVIGSLLVFAITIYYTILLNVSLAQSYGKEKTYAVGLILLPSIFYLMLSSSKNEYKGEQPMDDVVWNFITSKTSGKPNQPNENVIYCSACGGKMSKGTKFCPNCGKEVK